MKKPSGVLLVLALVLSVCLLTATPAAASGPPVTGGLILHLDADAIEDLDDGDPVETWQDLSSQGNHATQATPAYRPTYRANILNGRPVVRFDGSGTFMLVPPMLDPAQHNWSFFAVVTPAATVDQDIWQQLDGTTGPGRVNVSIRTVAAATQYSSFLGGSQRPSGIGVVSTRSNLVTQTWDGTTLAWWGDGTVGSTHTPTAEPANGGYHIGVNKGITGNWLHGDIAEILIYDRALTNEEREQVEQYLGVKWLSICVATATGTGTACFAPSEGAIEDLVAVDEAGLPVEGKPNLQFPHGFFALNVVGVTPGGTVTVSIMLPQPVPPGTQYWKHYNDAWHRIPMTIDPINPRIIHITLVDGGLGDASGLPNGTIIDQGGPGNPLTVGWEGSSVNKAAVLAPWLALLAALMAGASLFVIRHRRAET